MKTTIYLTKITSFWWRILFRHKAKRLLFEIRSIQRNQHLLKNPHDFILFR